jgi:hypothetical protein
MVGKGVFIRPSRCENPQKLSNINFPVILSGVYLNEPAIKLFPSLLKWTLLFKIHDSGCDFATRDGIT